MYFILYMISVVGFSVGPYWDMLSDSIAKKYAIGSEKEKFSDHEKKRAAYIKSCSGQREKIDSLGELQVAMPKTNELEIKDRAHKQDCNNKEPLQNKKAEVWYEYFFKKRSHTR